MDGTAFPFHHEFDLPSFPDVLKRAVPEDHEIGLLPDLDGPESLVGADLGRRHRGCRHQRVGGREPGANEEFELAMCQAVEDGNHPGIRPESQPHSRSMGTSGVLDSALPPGNGPVGRRPAAAGFDVLTYDRRGSGCSGRDDWPGGGAGQHADDAAGLLRALAVGPAIVVGVSSGGVVALALAARHGELVRRVVAWEPPAAGVVPHGEAITAEMMAPVLAYLDGHPGDYAGAQALLLSAILGFPVAVDDPAFAATRANAEPMVRDEPTITLERFTPASPRGVHITIGLGNAPLDLISDAARQFERWTECPVVVVDASHEVYLTDPAVLTGVVISTQGA